MTLHPPITRMTKSVTTTNQNIVPHLIRSSKSSSISTSPKDLTTHGRM